MLQVLIYKGKLVEFSSQLITLRNDDGLPRFDISSDERPATIFFCKAKQKCPCMKIPQYS